MQCRNEVVLLVSVMLDTPAAVHDHVPVGQISE